MFIERSNFLRRNCEHNVLNLEMYKRKNSTLLKRVHLVNYGISTLSDWISKTSGFLDTFAVVSVFLEARLKVSSEATYSATQIVCQLRNVCLVRRAVYPRAMWTDLKKAYASRLSIRQPSSVKFSDFAIDYWRPGLRNPRTALRFYSGEVILAI